MDFVKEGYSSERAPALVKSLVASVRPDLVIFTGGWDGTPCLMCATQTTETDCWYRDLQRDRDSERKHSITAASCSEDLTVWRAHCNTLQHTAHTATLCNTLYHTAARILQYGVHAVSVCLCLCLCLCLCGSEREREQQTHKQAGE